MTARWGKSCCINDGEQLRARAAFTCFEDVSRIPKIMLVREFLSPLNNLPSQGQP
jgi:hypothetical protein